MGRKRTANDSRHIGRICRLPCTDCDNITRHEVLACVDDDHKSEEYIGWEQYEIVACLGCEKVSFRRNWQSSDHLGYDHEEGIDPPVDHPEVFPPRRAGRKRIKREYDLPAPIRAIYDEVHQAIANSQRVLAGIGIRALVEAVCAEKGATGRTLEGRIDDLATKGVLTTDAARVLHGTRLLGNRAAHEVAAPSEKHLEAAIDIAEQLLMNVYILPKIGEALVPPGERPRPIFPTEIGSPPVVHPSVPDPGGSGDPSKGGGG